MTIKSFLDLGHGGTDGGAVGNGLKEKDINLAVGLKVKHHLTRHGVDVMLSRTGDTTLSLQERTNMANKWGANSFTSIHCNSATAKEAYGIETFCYKFVYRRMADCVHGKLLEDKSLYYTNRGVKEGNFHVIRESNMDACLVEMAFISNERDSQLLRNKQEQYAIAIAKGILAYHGIAWKDEVVAPPTQPSGEMYRIRKTWADASSQIGAYTVLDNAIKNCPKGYSVFNSKGVSVYSNASVPTPPPTPTPPPQKPNVDVTYKVNGYSYVKNLNDYAGVFGVNVNTVVAYPSKGCVEFRVSPLNKDYYPWVGNYPLGNYYDYAGVNGVAIDRLQMRLKNLSGYSIKYRVHVKGGNWLPWVVNDSDYAGIRGMIIDAIQVDIV